MLEQFKVEIADAAVRTVQSDPNPKTGEIVNYPVQVAYLHKPGSKYPVQFRLYVPKDRKGQGYPVGFYTIDPSSAYSGNGKLQFSMNKLLPIAAQAARAA